MTYNSDFNIILKNLDAKIDEQELRQKFSKFGEIQSLRISEGPSPQCKMAFIAYFNEQACESAIEGSNGTWLGSRCIQVSMAK